ncbi:chloride channel protein [Streptomyces sp. NPDC003996]
MITGSPQAVAGAVRAPITDVVILFELTGEYSIILPLMLAIVLATATNRLLCRDTIYTLKLRRRGIGLEGPAPGARIGAQHVGAVMEPLPSPLPATTALADAADLLSLSGHGALPVIDDTGKYVGVVIGQAVAEALAEQPVAAPTAVGHVLENTLPGDAPTETPRLPATPPAPQPGAPVAAPTPPPGMPTNTATPGPSVGPTG